MTYNHNDICRHVKTLHDAIHGYIHLTVFATKIIDTNFFQRLRKLKQLGVCSYVYPTGIHTRFEHSIGTYHIADEQLNTIVTTTDPKSIDNYLANIPELNNYYEKMYNNQVHPLDMYVCELIKIAALCHDIGHGPFSHVFDDVFIPDVGKGNNFCATHEERSGVMIQMLIEQDEILSKIIHPDEIIFIQNLINPTKNHTGFIYQIVSNTLNSLDVDKFDYLTRDVYALNFQAKIDPARLVKHIRVIDNNIVYPEQAVDDIYNLFQTRFRLHKEVYCHKVVIAIQFVIVKLMKLLDDILKISDSISNMNQFCLLTDEYILESVEVINKFRNNLTNVQRKNIDEAKQLIDDLHNRKLYAVICNLVSTTKIDIDNYLESLCLPDKDKIIVFQNKIGFVSGNKPNPLDSIFVFKTKDSTKIAGKLEAFKKNKNNVTALMPQMYQEYIITLYYADKTNVARINELRTLIENMPKT
jgi:HD superfamily phosphohydrolase